MKITTFIGSSRKDSNSELLADFVTKDIDHQKIHVRDLFIQPIHDLRHDKDGFQVVNDDYDTVIKAFLESDLLIFSTPIYWYSMSGIMKNMIDRLSHAIRDTRFPQLKEYLQSVEAIVIAVGGDKPTIKGLPLIQQFHYIFDFLHIRFSTYILGEGNRPGDILQDQQALAQANLINQRLKSLK
ncbi:flavodoxin family protein [Priestia taiwanensis]|uniref:NAD(P)H-dependent FMN-containing oxidoreductase YwqN n=1 Tax=Priestia taiwanensis TaxID=1347902 RepID=A0A917AL20_9BACI|nr:flavodoxin family protein [Priestia taiwanensis]MBM7362146.1 multimeric flavodoxin WrbA [Priestia taiwanensis]GGE59801.1 putative NAD(P)H-dependent FMN-containing oxidoreductase YwqN [Priestia taiwanensis]